MALSARAKKLVAEITSGNVKLGDLKTRGKEIKKDHALAMELWATGKYNPRLLSTLIFDPKLLTENVIDQLASDMLRHDAEERNQLADWLLANQLAKDKKLVSLMAGVTHHNRGFGANGWYCPGCWLGDSWPWSAADLCLPDPSS